LKEIFCLCILLNGGGLDVDLCEKIRSTAARDEYLDDELYEKGNENGK
jgi:hypothetical protein